MYRFLVEFLEIHDLHITHIPLQDEAHKAAWRQGKSPGPHPHSGHRS